MKFEKSTAFISYLGPLGTLIPYLKNKQLKSYFISFHIRQFLELYIGFIMLLYPAGNFDNWMFTLVFWIPFYVLIFFGISTALSGSLTMVPLVGIFFHRIFENLSQNVQ